MHYSLLLSSSQLQYITSVLAKQPREEVNTLLVDIKKQVDQQNLPKKEDHKKQFYQFPYFCMLTQAQQDEMKAKLKAGASIESVKAY